MKIQIEFPIEEIKSVFEAVGLEVVVADFTVSFNNQSVDIPMHAVKNPHTGEYEKLGELFEKYIHKRQRELTAAPGKLEIYNLFKREKR